MDDYKEKYEMALEKAKKFYNNEECRVGMTPVDLEVIFPELKESEDEKIKKWIIDDIKYNMDNELLNDSEYKKKAKKAIAWLEQQSKQSSNILWHDMSEEPEAHREIFCEWKGYADNIWHDVAFYHLDDKAFWNGERPIEDVTKWAYVDEILNKSNPYSGVSFKYNNHTWGMCARDGGVEISIDNELKAFVSIDKSFIYPISQSYLAPKSASQAIKEIVVDNANKVELKFHEGDFIKHNKSDIIYKVFSIDNNSYFLKNIETDEIAGEFEHFNLEQNFHLWTIKDAKEGDVLWHSDSASNGIFIFKEIRHDGKVLCYCDYDYEDHFCLGEHHTCCWINDKYIKPATKEQRYLLFKKMKEAGYKWNVDEKELIKL